MNISLPALIFANIVPAFTSQNVSALGPLFLLAFTYQGIGLIFGLIIREIFYVPRNFWQGIVVMTALSNWGNLREHFSDVYIFISDKPFDPATDTALGVSFVAIFIVSYNLVFWGEEAEARVSWRRKPIGSLVTKYILREKLSSPPMAPAHEDVEAEKKDVNTDGIAQLPSIIPYKEPIAAFETPELARRITRTSQHAIAAPSGPSQRLPSASMNSSNATVNSTPVPRQPLYLRILAPVRALLHPVTMALIVSLPIALVNPLKALFVDITTFLGNIAVPLALILLGASFARLQMPQPISRLPILAMVAVTLAKMVLLPVIGVFTVQSMVSGGLISHDSRVEKFVAMFLSGTPAAVNQLIISSLYAPDGNVDTLSAFLLLQYVFMFFSSSYVHSSVDPSLP
ncbi:hypothetical protein EUX98_g4308 [Antrodiella citrinella]|uniref:Auxin efflux carrier n=1 Tax=Antrodiella citrinella TaxID=2447956 RepID=A0A4S4MWB9_9APHY|nr:hypothetical protein EUX98_g4308 [Antrodiella citrinella]